MKFKLKHFAFTAIAASFLVACSKAPEQKTDALGSPLTVEYIGDKSRLDYYHTVELTADLSCLRKKKQEMLGVLFAVTELMEEMLARVKPIIGDKTPVTMPQIWIDSVYVGGADELALCLGLEVEANPERGQSSLSKKPARGRWKRRHRRQ